jgi:Flp pilus assembly protein CpaB
MQAVIRARRRMRPKSPSEKARGVGKKRRWGVVAALIPPALATTGVVLYSHRVEIPRPGHEPMVAVTVSEVDIPPGTDLDQVIKNDQLILIEVPQDAVVDGTVTSVDQLRHRRTRVAILAGELILVDRLKIGRSDLVGTHR